MQDDYLTPDEVVSEYPKVFASVRTLADKRSNGTGPAYLKLDTGRGGRILYPRTAIEAYLAAALVVPGGAS
jgi:hypothetical protein